MVKKNKKTNLVVKPASVAPTESEPSALESDKIDNEKYPAVSVIIPMYNAEEYISECLDSILNQTFRDFEVIIVDDCSTDSSCDIVESYMPKFGRRLRFTKTEKNSGGGGYIPRNLGFKQARGEYVLFMDADDFILLTALETLYTTAKENNADVVYTAAYYDLYKPNNIYVKWDGLNTKLLRKGIEDKTTLTVNNLNKILREFLTEDQNGNLHGPWSKFLRRSFLLDNDIVFPETLPSASDFIWCIDVYCHTKRFVRLLMPLYFYRTYDTHSISQKRRMPHEQVSYWISGFAKWINVLNTLTNRVEILRDNPAYSLAAACSNFNWCLICTRDAREKLNLSNQDIYEMIKPEFDNRNDLADFIMPLLFCIRDKGGKVVERALQTFDRYKEEIDHFKKSQALSTTYLAISVIIPMYNVEKYICECLDSLLAQTFQDFEVIVIDDGSTDSSCTVVESYISKFGERLSLYRMGINTKHPGDLRNIGLSHAHGEYIYFMDSDDAFIKTGLEEMYTLAKRYDADVVYCERYYMSEGSGEDFIRNIHVANNRTQKPPYVDKPTLDPEALSERVQRILDERYWATPWLKLVRRDLLDKHKIFFSHVKPGEDDIWTYSLIFFAKKFLRVPNMVYIRRMRNDSIMGTRRTLKQEINFWLNPVLLGLKELDKLMSQIEFFQENPQQRYDILKKEFQVRLDLAFNSAEHLSPLDVYETIKNEFSKNLGEYDVLISALCTQIFDKDKTLKETQTKLKNTDAKINKLNDSMSYILESRSIAPAISVIIPLYNAEKYIGACLDSILAQTFPNFEVIVVDDCSTDNGVAIVNSYISKFNGRLKISSTNKNSGSPGIPRNIGLNLANGEYVCFIDADDFILNSALETLYKAAKKYQTDVVYTSSYYLLQRPNEPNLLRDGLGIKLSKKNLEDKQTLTIDDPDKNLQQLIFEKNFNFSVMYFVRRDFLAKNQIVFPELSNGEDHLWVIQVYCYAKRFLRMPTPFYYYRRYTNESICTKKRTPREQISYWLSTFALWLKTTSELASRIEILNNNPAYILAAAKRHFDFCLDRTQEERKQLTSQDIYEILYNECRKANISSDLMMPFFFTTIDAQIKEIADTQNKISELKFSLSARLDVKFTPKFKGNLQLISVSDDKADVQKPAWLQKNGVGYQIESYAGQLEFIAKATADGSINLKLRGLDIRDPKDQSKRVSYWIDYTNLVINEKIIFDTLTPACWEKFYLYDLKVKAGEEIKIKFEWIPHRSNIIKPKSVLPPPKVTTPEPKNVMPPPKVTTPEPKIVKPLSKSDTARIDVKFMSQVAGNDFKILSVSDDKAEVVKPEWFQGSGIGYIIQSLTGELTFVAKATADGRINFNLRGLEVRSSEDWAKGIAKRIPYWIDYTNFTINGKTIFNSITPAWCDEPYKYNLEVKANEEVTVKVEWQPHRSNA